MRKSILGNQYSSLGIQVALNAGMIFLAPKNVVIAFLLLFSLLLLPGFAVIRLFQLKFINPIGRNFFALMFSILSIITFFTLYSVSLRQLGLSKPFNSTSVQIVGFILLASSLSILIRRRPGEPELDLWQFLAEMQLSRLLLVALPLTSLIVVQDLNFHRKSLSTTIFVSSLILILLFLAVNSRKYKDSQIESWVIYAISLSLVLGSTFRGTGGFWGYDINAEYGIATKILDQGYWLPPQTSSPYESMLSITVLPVVLTLMTKLSLTTIFKVFFPLVLAALPAVFYALCCRFVSRFIAIVVVGSLIIGSISYIPQLPALARQTIGLSFFAGLILIPFERRLSRFQRSFIGLSMAGGMAATHYSTAYLASVFFGFAFVVSVYSYLNNSNRLKIEGTVFTPAFCLSVVLITVVWNGLITNSLQDVKPVLSTATSQGLKLLPSSGQSALSKWISGAVAKPKITPEQLKANALEANKKYKVTPFPDWVDYEISPITIPNPEPILGERFGRSISNMLILGRTLFQGVAVLGIYLLLRRLFRSRSGKLAKVSLKKSVPLLDILGIACAAIAVGLILRVSSTFVNFYNPERAAIQISLVLIIPTAIGLDYLLLRRNIFQLFLAVPTVFFFAIIVLTASSLDGYIVGADVTRISATQTKYSPFIISSSERFAAQWVGSNIEPSAVIQTDSRGFLALLQARRNARIPSIDPYSLAAKSYIYATNSNIEGGIVRSQLIYKFPADYIDRHYDTIYSSNQARIYH